MRLNTPVKGSVRLATGVALLTKLPVLVADIHIGATDLRLGLR